MSVLDKLGEDRNRFSDPAKLAEAHEAQVRAHRARLHVLECLHEGHRTVASLRDILGEDKAYRKLRVRDVLKAVKGKKYVARYAEELRIEPDRYLVQLGDAQWQRLIVKCDGAWRP